MPHLLRQSSYLILALAFVCSLLLGAEFDLIGFATGGHPRHQKLELGELLTLSGLFSLLLAGIAVVNGRLARHERRKRTEIECTANLDALTSIANRLCRCRISAPAHSVRDNGLSNGSAEDQMGLLTPAML